MAVGNLPHSIDPLTPLPLRLFVVADLSALLKSDSVLAAVADSLRTSQSTFGSGCVPWSETRWSFMQLRPAITVRDLAVQCLENSLGHG